MPKMNFNQLFRTANPDALDLLDRMLAFDPSQRIGVETALEHPYLQIWHDASDEPNCPTKFDFGFEVVEDVPDMRNMILEEVSRFRQHVRQTGAQVQQMGGAMMGAQQGGPQTGVPIPDKYDARAYEDPRPEQARPRGYDGGLESDLQAGLDMQ